MNGNQTCDAENDYLCTSQTTPCLFDDCNLCLVMGDCSGGRMCGIDNECVYCHVDAHCGANQKCVSGVCFRCFEDADCPTSRNHKFTCFSNIDSCNFQILTIYCERK